MADPQELKTFEDSAKEMNVASGYGGSQHQPQEAGVVSDVTGSRVVATDYQNTSGKKRRVLVRVSGANLGPLNNILAYVGVPNPPTLIVSGMRVKVNATADHLGQVSFEVPKGNYYRVDVGSGDTMTSWIEEDE